jgi:hypothetical protein
MRVAALLATLVGAAAAWAQSIPEEPLQRRCWQSYTNQRTQVDLREPVSVTFTNLKSGYVVRSPFWVEFGIRGMGVVPAGNEREKAGHHHILVDKKLPSNHQAKLPFDDLHRHFGKGQTGTSLDLPEGRHTLRLLFADHEHRPYFVFSPEITVIVSGKRTDMGPRIDPADFDATCALWYQDAVTAPRTVTKEIYAKNVRSGEQVTSPMRLSLGVIGFGVAPADKPVKDTGHFAVTISQGGKLVGQYVWNDGRTESVLDLPRGDVDLETSFLGADGKTLMQGQPLKLTVARVLP